MCCQMFIHFTYSLYVFWNLFYVIHCLGSLFSYKEVPVHYIVRVFFTAKIVNMITLYMTCTHHKFYSASYHSVLFLSKAYVITILLII